MSESREFADGLSVGFDVGCVNQYKLPSSYIEIGTGIPYIEIGTGILSNHKKLTAIKTVAASYNHKNLNIHISISYFETDKYDIPKL